VAEKSRQLAFPVFGSDIQQRRGDPREFAAFGGLHGSPRTRDETDNRGDRTARIYRAGAASPLSEFICSFSTNT
jgi:hypothetical protein